MAKNNDFSKRARRAGEEPDVAILKGDWTNCVNGRQSNYWQRQRLNWETRYAVWAGQHIDGRKHARGKERVWPWEGASDARVHLIDKYVKEDVALLMKAWTDLRILVRPNAPARDGGWARKATALLRWLVYEEMEETEGEAELLANLLLERGAAALGVWWKEEEVLTREVIRMEQLEQAARMAAQRLQAGQMGDALQMQASLPALISDPTLEDQAVAVVQEILTGGEVEMSPARVKRALRQLRESGEAHYPRRIIKSQRPVVRALAWNEDIWTPPDTTELQRARQVFIREWITEAEVLERARALKWEGDYTDQMLETQRGRVMELSDSPLRRTVGKWNQAGVPETDELYEVVTAYENLVDEDGIPGIYATTFNPGMSAEAGVAASELVDYAHNKMPFVVFQTERRSRLVDDARGYGEMGSTLQAAIKKQWDARSDRADVSTLPPSFHPPGEEPDAWGPGVMVPTLQPDRYGYFTVPPADQGSREFEETVRRFADEYFGRIVDEQNRIEAPLLKQELVRKWMRGWKEVETMIFQLTQQYMPDEVYFRVVGESQGMSIRATREEIQGPFSVSLKFNTQDLDTELVQEKLGLIEKALQLDATGIIDRTEAVKVVFELIDPSYAERLVQPAEAAAMKEVKEEQDTFAKLLLGIQVDVQGNEAFQLRKQTLMRLIQSNPVAQKIMQGSPEVLKNVERRVKQLDFNIQQKVVNPEIGRRLGTEPAGMELPMGVEGGGEMANG